MDKITVIGAGMAGMLAGVMLRTDCHSILEAQPRVPNNHSALLRFRSSIVGDTIGIEFKKVHVLKAVEPWRNPVADALAYAKKCTGEYTLRSSLSAKAEMEERYIAPNDFISKMANRLQATVVFDHSFSEKDIDGNRKFISTMPMPTLMKLLKWEDIPEFRYAHGANINATINKANAYCTVYVPSPNCEFNRISITGDRLTIEFAFKTAEEINSKAFGHIVAALNMLGIPEPKLEMISNVEVKDQRYAKILPIDENIRSKFIIYASELFGIYSLGRFATWRPKLMMDDVVNDVRVIQRLINNGHSYLYRKV